MLRCYNGFMTEIAHPELRRGLVFSLRSSHFPWSPGSADVALGPWLVIGRDTVAAEGYVPWKPLHQGGFEELRPILSFLHQSKLLPVFVW